MSDNSVIGCIPMRNGNEEPCVIMNTEEPCLVMRTEKKGRKVNMMLMVAAISALSTTGANAQMGYGSAGAVTASSSSASACIPITITVTPPVSAAADQTTGEVDGVQGSASTSEPMTYITKTAVATLTHTTTFVKATQPLGNLTTTATQYNGTATQTAIAMTGTGTGVSSWATGPSHSAANGTYASPTATADHPQHAGAATSSSVSYTHLAVALIASAALGAVFGA
ncbi:hypothetical protein B0T13DRAFT_443735 [Neurospora crassa]|nr:hypothetical protein B0T13DRAFT_443735 [Neurospora crassa]